MSKQSDITKIKNEIAFEENHSIPNTEKIAYLYQKLWVMENS